MLGTLEKHDGHRSLIPGGPVTECQERDWAFKPEGTIFRWRGSEDEGRLKITALNQVSVLCEVLTLMLRDLKKRSRESLQ